MGLSAKGALLRMTSPFIPQRLRRFRPGPASQLVLGLGVAFAGALALVGPSRLLAQIEGDRGIPPVAQTTDIEVNGIEVNTTGKDADEARQNGWVEAQRKAWEQLKGPPMSDSQIQAMVSAVVIQNEQIGPHRYIAKLGVIFDRARAGQYIATGMDPTVARSAPMLVIPVLYSGGVAQVFEVRGPWQRAWANFGTGASPIDYVRLAGAGGESLLLTAGQPGRRSRIWWRNILDQFGASDVLIPIARLERQWPGGPVRGTFTARYGPDNTYLSSFTLTAPDDAGVPAMLNKALVQMDLIYRDALAAGKLAPDPTLVPEKLTLDPAIQALIDNAAAQERAAQEAAKPKSAPAPTPTPTETHVPTYGIQFSSPDARAVDQTLGTLRSVPGVVGATTDSIAIGGTSVLRVIYRGTPEELAAELRARGFSVSGGGGTLVIRR